MGPRVQNGRKVDCDREWRQEAAAVRRVTINIQFFLDVTPCGLVNIRHPQSQAWPCKWRYYFDGIHFVVLLPVSSNFYIAAKHTKFIKPTLRSTCFFRPPPSSGTEVRNLNNLN